MIGMAMTVLSRKKERSASAGLELSIDENFLNWYAHAVEEDGKWVVKHTSNIDFVQNHMQLTDMDTVLTIAEAGVTQAAQERKTRFDQFYGIIRGKNIRSCGPGNCRSKCGFCDRRG